MRNYYSAYQDNGFSRLYEPMRRVMEELGTAMWHFAQIKEMTWYSWGLQGITGSLHWLEHVYPDYIDKFKGLLAELGLPLVYPPIKQFTGAVDTIPQAFRESISIIDRVNDALSEFVEAADSEAWEPLAREAETIQMENFRPRAWLTQALTMSEQGASAASLDSWMMKTLKAPQKG